MTRDQTTLISTIGLTKMHLLSQKLAYEQLRHIASVSAGASWPLSCLRGLLKEKKMKLKRNTIFQISEGKVIAFIHYLLYSPLAISLELNPGSYQLLTSGLGLSEQSLLTQTQSWVQSLTSCLLLFTQLSIKQSSISLSKALL